jgi:hypothetical protein
LRNVLVENLQGHLAAEPRVASAIDLAHPACAKLPKNSVRTNRVADQDRTRRTVSDIRKGPL